METCSCAVLPTEGWSKTIHGGEGATCELSDDKWMCDLAFMVDLTKHLFDFNVKLQEPNHLLSNLLSNVKLFEAKLKLWQVQLERGNSAFSYSGLSDKSLRLRGNMPVSVESSRMHFVSGLRMGKVNNWR